MELRVLKYFLAVANAGSITRAANMLHLSQPTLSRQIKALEEELGRKLFTRGKYEVSLTESGLAFKNRAEEIVDMAERTKSEFAPKQIMAKGTVYIGGGETRAMSYLANIAAATRRAYPQISFHMYSGNADDVKEKLDKGLLDFGVLIEPTDISKYEFATLPKKDRWGLIVPADGPLASRRSIRAADLAGIPLLMSRQLTSKYGMSDKFYQWFESVAKDIEIAASYNLIYNAALLVKAGLGSAVALEGLVSDDSLRFVPFAPKLESRVDIVWKKARVRSAAADIFLSAILSGKVR